VFVLVLYWRPYLLGLAEFTKIASATAIGFAVMGFIGYFVRLLHIPVNNILIGALGLIPGLVGVVFCLRLARRGRGFVFFCFRERGCGCVRAHCAVVRVSTVDCMRDMHERDAQQMY